MREKEEAAICILLSHLVTRLPQERLGANGFLFFFHYFENFSESVRSLVAPTHAIPGIGGMPFLVA
jgi:hypothetical protein